MNVKWNKSYFSKVIFNSTTKIHRNITQLWAFASKKKVEQMLTNWNSCHLASCHSTQFNAKYVLFNMLKIHFDITMINASTQMKFNAIIYYLKNYIQVKYLKIYYKRNIISFCGMKQDVLCVPCPCYLNIKIPSNACYFARRSVCVTQCHRSF